MKNRKVNTIELVEKNCYQIKRIRAYNMYFWFVKDLVKHCYLRRWGGWACSVVAFKWPRDGEKNSKERVLMQVPGYFSSKLEAFKKLMGATEGRFGNG